MFAQPFCFFPPPSFKVCSNRLELLQEITPVHTKWAEPNSSSPTPDGELKWKKTRNDLGTLTERQLRLLHTYVRGPSRIQTMAAAGCGFLYFNKFIAALCSSSAGSSKLCRLRVKSFIH